MAWPGILLMSAAGYLLACISFAGAWVSFITWASLPVEDRHANGQVGAFGFFAVLCFTLVLCTLRATGAL